MMGEKTTNSIHFFEFSFFMCKNFIFMMMRKRSVFIFFSKVIKRIKMIIILIIIKLKRNAFVFSYSQINNSKVKIKQFQFCDKET